VSPAIWLPLVVFEYVAIAWLTYKTSISPAPYWQYALWATGCIPLWAFVARYSKDVVRDGIYFDIAFTLVYTIAIMYFTKSYLRFGINQYWGLMLVLFGLMLFRRGM
jgi:hypothetical protein